MRSPLLILTLAALTTLACKREDTSSPADGSTPTSDANADASNTSTSPTSDDAEPSGDAEPNADTLEACAHVVELVAADLGETLEMSEENKAGKAAECAKDIDTKRAAMSAEQWQTWHACTMAASTVEAAFACG